MPRLKIALFAPDAYKMPKNLKNELDRVYNKKVEWGDILAFHCARILQK